MDVIRHLQRFTSRRPGIVETLVGAVLLVAAATAARVSLSAILDEPACFALYFPAILAGSLMLGWRCGLLVAVLSAVTTDYLPIGPQTAMGTMNPSVLAATEYWVSAIMIVATAELLRRAVVKLGAAAEIEHALNRELRHRVNNSLALALAFASQTKRSAPDPAVFFAAFQSRLTALARANDILSSERLGDCHLPRLAETALEAFSEQDAITLAGAKCFLPSASCVPLVLALHELATNAVKHGALSRPGGSVALSWTISYEDERSDVVLHWIERGGPAVEHPTRKGLGSRLLVRQAGLDEVDIQFAPAGLECTMVVRSVPGKPATPLTDRPRAMASVA